MTTKSNYPKKADEAEKTDKKSGIIPTNSWLNVHGKAVFLNIDPKDIVVVKSDKYGDRVTFITSLEALRQIVEGEKQGANLGRFEA
jgi:hypothetical protein